MSSADTEPSFTTWDGLPVARDRPHGSSVVVRRPAVAGVSSADRSAADTEILVLHRASKGIDYEGDWAWTTPAGARLPGEPVALGAGRELFEEAGLAGYDVWPVDLSGDWAVWACDVPAGTPATLHDVEHDRFEWLPAAAAARRCLPTMVADNVVRAAALSSVPVTVRAGVPTDIDALARWRRAPHVTRWFGEFDRDTHRRLVQRLSGDAAVSVLVIVLGDRDIGYLQYYRLADVEEAADAAALAGPDAVGVDYLIGDAAEIGRGVGTRAIWSAVSHLAAAGRGARAVIADPGSDNPASIRALAKAGFVQIGRLGPDRSGRAERTVMGLDVRHWLGAGQPRR